MISKTFFNKKFIKSASTIFRPTVMLTKTKFNFVTLNKSTSVSNGLSTNTRGFSTKNDYPLMDSIKDISEWDAKVVQNKNLVSFHTVFDYQNTGIILNLGTFTGSCWVVQAMPNTQGYNSEISGWASLQRSNLMGKIYKNKFHYDF